MEPATSQNLDRFLAEYYATKMFALMPVSLGDPPKFLTEFYLAKRELIVREAWQISENDPDLTVLDVDDPPLIPPHIQTPPVAKALDQVRAIRARRKRSH
jgi:hypothetical protein